MTPEMQARVFDPFFTTKAAGHGLGLAVVSGAVRSVGGVMRLTSEAGRGSTFRVLLPCAGSVATTVPRADDRTGPEGAIGVGTALIVEDEEALRGAAATMLRKSGLSVLEAPDGTVAIEMIRNSRPIDVLLLDVTLPGTPSREVLAEAKRLRPAMRVIVTSAYGEDFAAASLQGTFERFIRKPYSLSDLVGAVRQTLA
jgi:CheY-like chemotaxis protein